MQGLGRTHRSNQSSAPIYTLVHTDLKGQKRFLSSIARRLSQLGALTKGQSQAASGGVFNAADNLESTEATEALQVFFNDLVAGRIESIDLQDFEQQTGLKLTTEAGGLRSDLPPITRFMNRLLSLKYDLQNRTFDEFDKRLQAKVQQAEESGTLDQGVENLKADKVEKISEQTVYTDERTGAETKYVKLKVSDRIVPNTYQQALAEAGNDFIGFSRPKGGKIYAVVKSGVTGTDTGTGSVFEKYRLISPDSKRFEDSRKVDKWNSVGRDEAQRDWDAAVRNLPEFKDRNVHLITGVILPIWDRLRGQAQVRRMITEEGEHLLGRIVPNRNIESVLRNLGASFEREKVDTSDVARRLARGEVEVILSNDWKLRGVRVQGERRIELFGPSFMHETQLKADGVTKEVIASKPRYFVPTGTRSAEVLEKISTKANRPIVDVIEMAGRVEGMVNPLEPPVNPVTGEEVPTQMPMRLERPAGFTQTAAASDVIKALEDATKALGREVPLRVGNISRKLRGTFKVDAEVVRITTANDLPAASHEFAHAIEKIVFGYPKGGPWKKPQVDGTLQKELIGLGQALYSKGEPSNGYKREVFAEFVRLWITDTEQAQKHAPQFYDWFETTFLTEFPKAAKELHKAQQKATIWKLQGSRKRAEQSIVDSGSAKERLASLRQRLKKGTSIETHIEMLEPFNKVVKAAEKQLGKKTTVRREPVPYRAGIANDAPFACRDDGASFDD